MQRSPNRGVSPRKLLSVPCNIFPNWAMQPKALNLAMSAAALPPSINTPDLRPNSNSQASNMGAARHRRSGYAQMPPPPFSTITAQQSAVILRANQQTIGDHRKPLFHFSSLYFISAKEKLGRSPVLRDSDSLAICAEARGGSGRALMQLQSAMAFN